MTNIALTTTPTKILNASPDLDRAYVIYADAKIYLCVDGDQNTVLTSSNGIPVAANTSFSSLAAGLDARMVRQAVYAMADSGTVNVRVQAR